MQQVRDCEPIRFDAVQIETNFLSRSLQQGTIERSNIKQNKFTQKLTLFFNSFFLWKILYGMYRIHPILEKKTENDLEIPAR